MLILNLKERRGSVYDGNRRIDNVGLVFCKKPATSYSAKRDSKSIWGFGVTPSLLLTEERERLRFLPQRPHCRRRAQCWTGFSSNFLLVWRNIGNWFHLPLSCDSTSISVILYDEWFEWNYREVILCDLINETRKCCISCSMNSRFFLSFFLFIFYFFFNFCGFFNFFDFFFNLFNSENDYVNFLFF